MKQERIEWVLGHQPTMNEVLHSLRVAGLTAEHAAAQAYFTMLSEFITEHKTQIAEGVTAAIRKHVARKRVLDTREGKTND